MKIRSGSFKVAAGESDFRLVGDQGVYTFRYSDRFPFPKLGLNSEHPIQLFVIFGKL